MTHRYRATSIALCLLLALSACGPEPEVELTWPGWRGPVGSGITDAAPLPVTWSPGSPNIRWSVEVPGRGNSSPIVAGGRIFLTSAVDPDEETEDPRLSRFALAFDLETGEQLWQREVAMLPAGKIHRTNTPATPTPATDGRTVFVYFGSVIAALDAGSGKVRWEKQLEPEHFAATRYGASSSPVLTGKAVIVVQDQEAMDRDGGWMTALAKESGEELWRIDWDDSCCSYSTPLVVDRGSGDEIIFAHSGRVASYDAASGEELWRRKVPISQMVSSPVLEGDLLGVAGGAHNIRSTQFFELRGSGRDTLLEPLWETPKFSPHTSSPVLYEDKFYAVTDNGVLTCFDARSGRLFWKSRIGAGYRASLLAGDGKVYALASVGATTVVRAFRKFQKLAFNELDDPQNNASPAVAGGCLLIRTRHRLHCIEAEAAEPAAGSAKS